MSYLLLRLLLLLMRLLPFSLIYVVARGLAWFLQKVLRYRRAVVRGNLKRCFPEHSEEALRELEGRFYRHLADIMLEGVKGMSLPGTEVAKHYTVINTEMVNAYTANGRSLIVVTGHCGNWEWVLPSVGPMSDVPILCFFKPIANQRINDFFRRRHQVQNITLVPISQTSNTFEERKETPTVYIMAADQSPSNKVKAIKAQFFGAPLYCLHGPEKHARAHNLVVCYSDIRRVGRGKYQLELHLLTDDAPSLPEGALTQLYMNSLEGTIRRQPESWLWSHKRWKHQV